MSTRRTDLLRISGFALVAFVFAVTQPLLLIGFPLALLLVTFGPGDRVAAVVVLAVGGLALVGERSGLWWFERGWPILLGGAFVWVSGWGRSWSFSGQALAALGLASIAVAVICALSPGLWASIDSAVAARASRAAAAAGQLLGDSVEGTVRSAMEKAVALQIKLFPALIWVSSLGGLGAAVSIRSRLAGEAGIFGPFRSFRFNDHLIWLWLVGLTLLVAPVGEFAERVGSNAALFMGLLYALRGLAVFLSLVGGVSVLAGVVTGLVAVLLYPVLVMILVASVLVGLGDTWFNVRERFREQDRGG